MQWILANHCLYKTYDDDDVTLFILGKYNIKYKMIQVEVKNNIYKKIKLANF